MKNSEIQFKEVTPGLWPEVLKLFGEKGACGGCWCQYWRIAKGEKWEQVKGDDARKRLEKGIKDSTMQGALAFVEGEPVGWATFGPRPHFSRLDRAPSFTCDDAEKVWSIPCFFIKSGFRGRGVAGDLLRFVAQLLQDRGVKILEGYPSKPGKDGKYVAAFAWTGTQSLFEKAGFEIAGNEDGGKPRVRKRLA
jgi:GNAT superfamily N-acetyltransferase